jgi:hypothetical protein
MNVYIFSLEKVHIANTRSRHDDTDKVVFGLGIGKQSFQVKSLSIGNVNNGDHNVGLNFPVLLTDPTTAAVFSYSIYNGDDSALPKSLVDLTQSTAQAALDDLMNSGPATAGPGDFTDPSQAPSEGGEIVPWQSHGAGSADAGWYTLLAYLGIADFVFPNCDGLVAFDTVGQKLNAWDDAISASSDATLRRGSNFLGSDSPSGCGSNSDYTVTWSVTRKKIVGSLRQFLKANGLALHPGMRSLV